MDQEPKKNRRVRYNGTHPKIFKEKYKELAPQDYKEDIENILQQGRTPAGMHRSICVDEILEILQIKPGHRGIDATLGYGGHSAEMLKCLLPNGKLFGIDVDPFELPKTKERLAKMGFGEDVLSIRKMNFSNIEQLAAEEGKMNFVLADLGVSSMQIDNPERGFSFKVDGPLDLRLNPNTGKSAAKLLQSITTEKLSEIFTINADEPNAIIIANFITNKIKLGAAIHTTMQLQETIKESLSFLSKLAVEDTIKKTCQRCFQALRIAVNDEFTVLDKFLERLPNVLGTGGRIAILSFHSGEDRRVKKSFQQLQRDGIYKIISDDFIKPTAQECFANPRAKSAKLRWAIKN
jgi:16S rRNA (cytosine1402-N4)-methyltransferase